MPTIRTAALALALTGLAAGPALAATCNLTVLGASVLDDATCTLAQGRGLTRVDLPGGTIVIRRSVMSARLAADPGAPRPGRARLSRYGQVTTSNGAGDKTCYFNQRAVLCVEP